MRYVPRRYAAAVVFAVLLVSAVVYAAPTSITVTLTPKQVKALKAEFGDAVDVTAKVQGFVNDWLVQYERNADEKEKRSLKDAFESADAATQAQVKALLKLKQQ